MRTFELNRHANILRLGTEMRDAKSERVCSVLLDHVQRIDAVPLGLGHGFAVAVQNLGMDVDLFERNFAHVVEAS